MGKDHRPFAASEDSHVVAADDVDTFSAVSGHAPIFNEGGHAMQCPPAAQLAKRTRKHGIKCEEIGRVLSADSPPDLRRSQLAGLILASALITLDGTATTIALPVIGRDLSASVSRLQWIANAPLLMLAAMLMPAGLLADRYGRIRVMRIGLLAFACAAVAAAAAGSAGAIVAAKLAQGAAGALVLPASLAILRGAHSDPAKRTRVFGVWAAWTGAASAAGPLLAGALVDLWSWRAVFIPPAVAAVVAVALLGTEARSESADSRPIPVRATVALIVLLGGMAYLFMQGPVTGLRDPRTALGAALAAASAVVLARDRHRDALFPRELLTSRNCLPANATTFAMYFGMFGLSFLIVLYGQQVLGYSAMWTALVLLPISVMLLFAERFSLLTASMGTRSLIVTGALAAAGGIAWMCTSSPPLPFWSHLIPGTALFGLGISLSVSALTNAAVAAVPDTCAGVASGLNHAVVRAAGMIAVALLGSIAAPGISDVVSGEGVQRAMMICAAVVATGGVAGAALLRDHEPGGMMSVAVASDDGSG
jgi:predicted MFS family arabinose efflux permease